MDLEYYGRRKRVLKMVAMRHEFPNQVLRISESNDIAENELD